MNIVQLDVIRVDAGTQIRAAINEHVVAEYAEQMSEGVTFPPVVLFHDGTDYYLADGFHRRLASQRVGFKDISADVRAGTKTDALWFALGANKANAHRMTVADKRHAIVMALQTWPEISMTRIAEQSGCAYSYVHRVKTEQVITSDNLPDRVTGKDGKSYPASQRKRPERETLKGNGKVDKSRAGIQQRHERMRTMAAEGSSSRQIAAALGLSEEGCRGTLRKAGISVPGDVTAGLRRHDSTRIMEHIVMDAENLTADVNLIEFSDLDPARFAEWLASLNSSRHKLSEFIRGLTKEQQKHGEAA